jgi:PAS domain S-box-containing protein
VKTLKEIKDETNLPAIMTNHQGFIIYVNDAFRVVFGWTEAEIVGQTLEAVIPSSFHDSHHLGFSRFAMTEMPTVLNHPLELKAVRYDGSEINAEHFITAEKQEGEWIFGAILRPLSD